jgi:hypothetical protein
METFQVERRASYSAPSHPASPIDAGKIVRHAVLLQGYAGTAGAVEYLKSNGISGTVIGRVLSGGVIRHEDEAARDRPRAWD